MRNLAGVPEPEVSTTCRSELEAAGIDAVKVLFTPQDEVRSMYAGWLHGWHFRRAWYYWVARGPGLPLEYAVPLHEAHGKTVRVDGHCMCPSPIEWCKGTPVALYHVDSQEGLKALADALKKSVADALEKYGAHESSER